MLSLPLRRLLTWGKVILQLRLYALYYFDKKILIFMGVVSVSAAAASAAIMGIALRKVTGDFFSCSCVRHDAMLIGRMFCDLKYSRCSRDSWNSFLRTLEYTWFSVCVLDTHACLRKCAMCTRPLSWRSKYKARCHDLPNRQKACRDTHS